MPQQDPSALAAALRRLDAHYQAMPPVAAMRVGVEGFDGAVLHLHAPLAAHLNDKGCAFGGSLVSLMTLAGWGVVNLQLQQAGVPAEVFVADSEVRYLAPLFADLRAQARLAEGESWDGFLAALRRKGRARCTIAARVDLPDGGIAASCHARYVAIATG